MMIKSNLSRRMKRHDMAIMVNYEKLAETGKIIQAHIEKYVINPKSLRKVYILALNVHHNEDREEKVTTLKPFIIILPRQNC